MTSCKSERTATKNSKCGKNLSNGPSKKAISRNSTKSEHLHKNFKIYKKTFLNLKSFEDTLAVGPCLSIFMLISIQILVFLSTFDAALGAKTFYMHWNTSNSM